MSETITTTTAREGIQTLGTVGAEPVGWDGCEDMPEAYGHACAELTAEALTRAGMLVLGVLGDTDLVFVEGDEVCVGIVTPLPSQLIDVTTEDLEESLSDACEELPLAYLSAAMAVHAVSAALGLDTSGYSFGYVASWAVGKTNEEMRQCMKGVRDAAKQIIDRLQLVMEP